MSKRRSELSNMKDLAVIIIELDKISKETARDCFYLAKISGKSYKLVTDAVDNIQENEKKTT